MAAGGVENEIRSQSNKKNSWNNGIVILIAMVEMVVVAEVVVPIVVGMEVTNILLVSVTKTESG